MDVTDMVDAFVRRVRHRGGLLAYRGDDELWRALGRDAHADYRACLESMDVGRIPPRAVRAEAPDLVRQWVRRGLPLSPLLSLYRDSHAVIWRRALTRIGTASLDSPQGRQTVEQVSDHLFAWYEAVSTSAADAFAREGAIAAEGSEQKRLRAVSDVLSGRSSGSTSLGYDLALAHVSVVATGARAAEAMAELKPILSDRALIVRIDDTTAWGWFGRYRDESSDVLWRLRRYRPPTGIRISASDVADGIEGFRAGHEQAAETHRIARACGESFLTYDEAALEVLTLRDEERARAFVERELATLARPTKRASLLRETLRAYFLSAQNGCATAARLGVHEQTVTYRLRGIEEQIGRPVTHRRAELETALRLCVVLSGSPSVSVGGEAL